MPAPLPTFLDLTYLDDAYELLQSGSSQVAAGLTLLYQNLDRQRSQQNSQQWQEFCQQICPQHPILKLLQQDPFTRHSVQKPRGYTGDAVLLDYIYGRFEPDASITDLGQQIFDYSTNTAAPKSVRSRLSILAATIDEVAARLDHAPRVAAIACGHLREAFYSEAIREDQLQELIALDQDPQSLATVTAANYSPAIRTVQASVRDLLMHKQSFADLDLIYTAGLYDYLGDRTATRLTQLLVTMLRPGGQLLIANFMPCLKGVGYMEACGQWQLIYRTERKMLTLVSEAILSQLATIDTFFDRHQNVVFLKLNKR